MIKMVRQVQLLDTLDYKDANGVIASSPLLDNASPHTPFQLDETGHWIPLSIPGAVECWKLPSTCESPTLRLRPLSTMEPCSTPLAMISPFRPRQQSCQWRGIDDVFIYEIMRKPRAIADDKGGSVELYNNDNVVLDLLKQNAQWHSRELYHTQK
jgi:hypothetical protein